MVYFEDIKYWCGTFLRYLLKVENLNSKITRKSSCVNARGIPPAVYQVILWCSLLGGGGYPIQSWPEYPHQPDGGTPC